MIALASLFLYSALTSATNSYLYLYCGAASTYSGGPGCIRLYIYDDLTGYMLEDAGGTAIPLEPNLREDFLGLITPETPILVPRKAYEQKDSWKYKDIYVFSKAVRNFSTDILGVPIAADIIEVRDIRDRHVLTFWYSQDKGVQAMVIGSQLFYCSKSPCLLERSVN